VNDLTKNISKQENEISKGNLEGYAKKRISSIMYPVRIKGLKMLKWFFSIDKDVLCVLQIIIV